MLKLRRTIGRGVALVQMNRADDTVKERLHRVLAAFYGTCELENYPPHVNDYLLRREILAINYFDDFRGSVESFSSRGFRVVVIEELYQASRSTVDRNAFLLALGLALGYPTPSDRRVSNVLWDVKQKAVAVRDSLNFSGRMVDADLHTDSQYFPIPESYTLLYAVHRSKCGGGVSKFCTADDLIDTLSATQEGFEAYTTLRDHDVPFQIYDPYFSDSLNLSEGVDALVFPARVFGKDGSIRYRGEIINHGFRTTMGAAPQKLQAALRGLAECLTHKIRTVEHILENDSLAICDNHRALHGRSAFSDPLRHLIRLRLAQDPVPETVAMQRLQLRSLRAGSSKFSLAHS